MVDSRNTNKEIEEITIELIEGLIEKRTVEVIEVLQVIRESDDPLSMGQIAEETQLSENQIERAWKILELKKIIGFYYQSGIKYADLIERLITPKKEVEEKFEKFLDEHPLYRLKAINFLYVEPSKTDIGKWTIDAEIEVGAIVSFRALFDGNEIEVQAEEFEKRNLRKGI